MAQGRCAGEPSKQAWVAVSSTLEELGEKAHPAHTHCSGWKIEGCHTPHSQGQDFLPSCSRRKRVFSTKAPTCRVLPRIPSTLKCNALEPCAGGTRRWWAAEGGEGGNRSDQQLAHAQIQAPASSPTVGTATPRSPAASPGPAATARGRELRPQVALRPASLFLRRQLAGG